MRGRARPALAAGREADRADKCAQDAVDDGRVVGLVGVHSAGHEAGSLPGRQSRTQDEGADTDPETRKAFKPAARLPNSLCQPSCCRRLSALMRRFAIAPAMLPPTLCSPHELSREATAPVRATMVGC